MSDRWLRISPWILSGLYLFAAVLVVMPLLDLVTSVLPPRPGDFSWRYGVLGLGAGYLHTPMLGFALALGLTFASESRWGLVSLGVLGVASSVVLGMLMVVFALDVLQMRGVRAEEVQTAVLAGGVLQELKYGTAALVLFVLGVGALKTASGQRARAEKPRPAAGLVTAGRSERAGDVPDRKAGAGAPRAV